MDEPYDWWDHGQIQKFQEARCKAYLKIVKRYHDATEKGDDAARKKAATAMSAHRKKDEVYKKKAEETYFYWY